MQKKRTIHVWLIRVIGLIVPERLRADWRQEWEAELRYRETMLAEWDKLDWKHKLDLLRRSIGAFKDALLLQPQRWEDDMMQDLRFGIRMLWKHRGFTLAAILTLALGIGANTAIFSVVYAALLQPLPYTDAEQLLVINELNPQQSDERLELSYPNFLELQAQQQSFERVAAYVFNDYILTGNGDPARIKAMTVSGNYFEALGLRAALGRTFLPAEAKPGSERVVMLSHSFWQRRFGAASPLGQTLILNEKPHTIIGVMPPRVLPDEETEMWLPVVPEPEQAFLRRRSAHIFQGLGRLKPGVTEQQATTELATIFARIQQQHPGEDPTHTAMLTPLREVIVGEMQTPLLLLFGAVGFVLLIACANVANLLLARNAMRQRELAIRAALGAGRWRVLRQLLTESLLLAGLGGVIGLLLAKPGLALLVAQLPDFFPRWQDIGLDRRALSFTAALSLLTGIGFGLLPAWQMTRPNLNVMLKESGTQIGGGANRGRLRNTLVVAEIALSFVLLSGAGLFLKSFWKLMNVHPGFQSDNLLTMKIALPEAKYQDDKQVVNFYQQLPERLQSLPGVTAVSAVNRLPVSGGDSHGYLSIEGRPFKPGDAPGASYRRILPNYFRAMGIPLLRGREFDARDAGGRPDVVIINEHLAQRFWPHEDPVGKRIKVGGGNNDWLTIVGIVGNVSHTRLDAENDLATYEPHAKRPWTEMELVVRANVPLASLAPALTSELKAAEKDLLIENVVTMKERIASSVTPRRLFTALLGLFAGFALLLAVIGIYGVIAYGVSQRTHEIGLRMALGAAGSDVLKLILRQGMKLTLAGVTLGLLAALGLTRLLQGLLFNVSATDPLTFAAIAVLLLLVALLACWLPARRATKVDPMVALRHE